MTLAADSFRGASRDSLAELRERITEDAAAVDVEELFAVAELVDDQPTLRRALTDPSRSAEARAELATSLLRDQVSAGVAEFVAQAARLAWSRVRDLGDAVEYLGGFAQIVQAERAGVLDELEDELFRFGRIVQSNPELRAALGDSTVARQRRGELADSLLDGRASEPTRRLVRQSVLRPRGRDLLAALDTYARVAAEWRERLLAVVRTVVPLSEEHLRRLREVLSRQYGRQVDLNVVVDEAMMGGLRVEIGDDVIDGSVAARLDQARRKLAS